MEVKNGVLISISIDDILDETLVIPDVLEINDNLFNNLFIKKIIFTSDVKLNNRFFLECPSLKEVEFKKKRKIEDNLFRNTMLEKIVFSSNLEIIGESAFKNCKKLDCLKFPSSLKRIEMNAFWNCVSLKNIEFNANLEYIGSYAFGNTKIENVSLLSLKDIGLFPFHMCKNLIKVNFNQLFHNALLDDTNSCLREVTIASEKFAIMKKLKGILKFDSYIVIRYSDDSFMINDKIFEKKRFDVNYVNELFQNNLIFNLYYWSSYQDFNPVAVLIIPRSWIRSYIKNNRFYNDLLNKYAANFEEIYSLIKFITIFDGLSKRKIDVETLINRIGIKSIVKQFKQVNIREFNYKFKNIYLNLLENYDLPLIEGIMPFLYNNIEKVSNSKDNIDIELIDDLQYLTCSSDVKIIKIAFVNNYNWLDNSNPFKQLRALILGSMLDNNCSTETKSIRLFNIVDRNRVLIATACLYFNDNDKYLLFNSIKLTQSFITRSASAVLIRDEIIDNVLLEIQDVLNFLNEINEIVSKVHVSISARSIQSELLNRGTKVIFQNL